MAAVNESEYVRICPTCSTQHAPQVMRCTCGALLASVDLVRPQAQPVRESAAPDVTADAQLICPFADCAQPNPPGSETCVYCDRPLLATVLPAAPALGLLQLPVTLQARYRVIEVLPASGAEAELSLVEPLAGGPTLLAKLYRKGVMPKRAVRERLALVDEAHRVHIVEEGVADGFAYEVMEYCTQGSLRGWLKQGVPAPALLQAWIQEINEALAAVHAVGLVHRDLKPENILVRTRDPVDLLLTDFGIASVLDATQRFTTDARTLSYAAPESLSGVIDIKADYWALGMIVLEAALGSHPFAGLSDQVILHHLTTRAIDLSAVHDVALRKLLRGLLLRDPKRRWAGEEVRRWLANDPTLPEEMEQGAVVHFVQAYRLQGEVCDTPLQLATALAKHWRAGATDIGNGQLLAWFRDVQQDQDAVRLLLEMRFERTAQPIHVDMQLLHLILHLAPGIPPVWRGESVELHAILRKASQALKGDAEAAHWLDVVHQRRVLQAYADAGNAEAADLVARWAASVQAFDTAWKARVALLQQKELQQPGRVVFYDEMVYGTGGPKRPPVASLHPRLLALAYDPTWSERLRRHVMAQLAPLLLSCPWLSALGDPNTMAAAELLVLEALLPEAKKAADAQHKTETEARDAGHMELQRLQAEALALRNRLGELAAGDALADMVCEDIMQGCVRYEELLARLRSADATREDWRSAYKEASGAMPLIERLHEAAVTLMQRRAVTRGWLSWRVAVFFVMCLFVLPLIPGTWPGVVLIASAAGIIVWRLLPNRALEQRIRRLGESLQNLQ